MLRLLAPGERVVIPDDAYGGTYRLVSKVLGPAGIEWGVADLTDVDALDQQWVDGTRMVWVETPTNPALTIVDIAAVCEVAHARGALVVVDNTFATPYLQQPLALGADVVVHSATKYLGGHSDVIGGCTVTSDPDIAERVQFLQKSTGAVPSPFDCFLVMRGIKTLAVRMERHCANARAVAELLDGHPAVARVLYPGLPAHPGHDVARRQMHDFGGMVSFVAAGGEEAALRTVAADAPVRARGVARRRRVAHRAPGPHDPCLGGRLTPGRRPGPRPDQRRHRARRRPPRRPHPGPRMMLWRRKRAISARF